MIADDTQRLDAFLTRYHARVEEWARTLEVTSTATGGPETGPDHPPAFLVPRSLEVHAADADRVLSGLLDEIAAGSPQHSRLLARIRDLVGGGELLPLDLLRASLDHEPDPIEELAARLELPVQALRFVGVYLARPFLRAAGRRYEPAPEDAPWGGATCPLCGHWAALALLVPDSGRRELWCRHCTTRWPVERLKCPACGNTTAGSLGYLAVEDDTCHRIDVCHRCRRFVRTIDLRGLADARGSLGIDLEDLAGADLELAAVQEGLLPLGHAGGGR